MQTHTEYRTFRMVIALLTLALVFTGCGGGGGGGGNSGGGSATVTGIVLSASSDTPPSSAATVVIGGSTVQTNADGSFTLNTSPSATTATISASGEVTRTITVKLASGANALGDIYLADTGSDYTASVQGRVVAKINGTITPISGATVTIANVTTTSAANGTFTLSGLPVGLGTVNGLYGKVTDPSYDDKLISADTLGFALVTGVNQIGDLLIAKPSGNTPIPPYNISGVVKVNGVVTTGVTVYIAVQNIPGSIASSTPDANGAYYFWVAPGQYTIQATDTAGTTQQVNVTLPSLNAPVLVPLINLNP